MLAVAASAPASTWNTVYLIVGSIGGIVALIILVLRPVAGRTRRAADAAAKLAFDSATAAAKLVVEAAVATNKLASDSAEAAAALTLQSALRNQKIDDRLESLLKAQESHEKRLTMLERAGGGG